MANPQGNPREAPQTKTKVIVVNLQILSAEIVRRVHHSPDSAHNLAETVAGLIREERVRFPSHLTGVVDPRDAARGHIQAALDDIRDGFDPEAVMELYKAANQLKARCK